jgi:putative DNA primase/helicase
MSAHEAISDMIHAMELEGMKPIEPIANRLSSGELIRFRCEGDGKGRLNGWARLYLDERPAGAFGNYRLGIDRKWKLGAEYQPLSREEREAMQREWAEAKAKRLEERERSEAEAAVEAGEMWAKSGPANSGHLYVFTKSLETGPLRILGEKLLVPMFDAAGKLWNLQRIAPDGTKRFLRGGRTDGLFCIIGKFSQRGETACIGEGYATMSAVRGASGHPCIVAFSAKNIAAVARLWNDARPDLKFIICADDDSHLERNIGLEAATAAAEAIGAKVARPLGRTPAEVD